MGEYRRWQGKSAVKVVTELETIVARYSPGNIEFVDDYFFVDAKRVGQICAEIIRQGLQFRWSASCRIDQFASFTDDYVAQLAQSGLRSLCFGAESHSDHVLKILNKPYRFEQAEAVIEKCKRYDIVPIFNYIVGVPGETRADVDLTVGKINLLKGKFERLEVSAVSIYVPFPGSNLYTQAIQSGLREPTTLAEWSRWQFTSRTDYPWIDKKHLAHVNGLYYSFRIRYIIDEIRRRLVHRGRITRWALALVLKPLEVLENWRVRKNYYEWHVEGELIKRLTRRLLADVI